MNDLELKANAKINLALAVKNIRSDGYHDVELIFQEIDFADTLLLSKSEDIFFSTDSIFHERTDENLCVKAAKLLRKKYSIGGVKIHLSKTIPIGAGLGGGSSDAASTLKGVVRLYELDIHNEEIAEIAVQLGADVPFFLMGGSAYGRGIGEILEPIKIDSDYYILLILPNIKISTVWAYKNLKLGLTRKNDDYKFRGFRFQNLDLADFGSELYNDFENPVFKQYPDLAEIKFELYDHGALFASLSGSGSTLYGLYSDKDTVKKAYDYFSAKHICRITKPVVRN
jgi:4-diphosphocytidyl-2-C-methyl-D-erythritol kinase